MNLDGSKKDLLKTDNDQPNCVEFESVQAIINEYGGTIESNYDSLDIKIVALSLEEFQRLPKYIKVLSTFDGMKEFFPKDISLISRMGSKSFFNSQN